LKSKIILGLDIGGSGIKGALVDVSTGEAVSERQRIETPKPATPTAVAETVQKLIKKIGYKGTIVGCGFPAIIKNGVSKSASNIEESWIGENVEMLLSRKTSKEVFVLNDADAAGVAEINFGKLKDAKGVSLLLTLGTGIGSALFINGQLVPNTEFGHIYLKDHKKIVEKYASNLVRKRKDLSYKEWITRLNENLHHLNKILSPSLVVLGGGVSKKFDEFKDHFDDFEFDIKPAKLLNHAGIIGAAMYAQEMSQSLFNQEN
jgi:polyphosphate glucokinase